MFNGDPVKRELEAEIKRLRMALEQCKELAGRLGPPNEIDACKAIERVAKVALLVSEKPTSGDRTDPAPAQPVA